MEPSNNIHSVSFQLTTQKAPVLFTRFRHYWWKSWSRGSWTSQRSITFLIWFCSGQYKIFKNFLNFCCLKDNFSIEKRFSLQQATGNHCVMELVVQWNAILQNEFCRNPWTTKFWTIARCRKYAKKKLKESLALTKKTWSRWERRWRRGSKVVRQYLVQEAVIILFPSEHHKLNTNRAIRMIRLWTSMTSKFQPKLILATLHHRLTSLACTIRCSESV